MSYCFWHCQSAIVERGLCGLIVSALESDVVITISYMRKKYIRAVNAYSSINYNVIS